MQYMYYVIFSYQLCQYNTFDVFRKICITYFKST